MAVVRRVGAAEWRDLRSLRLSALAGEPTAFWTTYAEAAARPDSWWQEYATKDIWIADAGDAGLVGMAAWFADDDGTAQVIAVWVEPDHRGTGAADGLMAAVEAAIRNAGHDRATLWVNEVNPRARRVYERRGYVATGRRLPMEPHPGVIEIEMAKPLA